MGMPNLSWMHWMEKGSVAVSPTRALLEGVNQERAARVVTPVVGQGWAWDSIQTSAGWSAGAAKPGQHQRMELADAVFYQLLWKPAAILIASSGKWDQSCFPQHNPLVHGAQGGEPQARGRISTWYGHVEMQAEDRSSAVSVLLLVLGVDKNQPAQNPAPCGQTLRPQLQKSPPGSWASLENHTGAKLKQSVSQSSSAEISGVASHTAAFGLSWSIFLQRKTGGKDYLWANPQGLCVQITRTGDPGSDSLQCSSSFNESGTYLGFIVFSTVGALYTCPCM